MNKLDIANELLKNDSLNIIEDYISNYTDIETGNCKDKTLLRINDCIAYIKESNFDITGWKLYEIPVFYSHSFCNKETNKFFDLAVWDIGEVIPRYLDSNINEKDSKTIQEAISNYVLPIQF